MKIILDAMGGDHAPKAPVLGALAADKQYEIVLVGDSDAIWEILKEQGHTTLPENISVVHTTEVVDMHDDPANVVRQKKGSSMMVALKMLADGLSRRFGGGEAPPAVMSVFSGSTLYGVFKSIMDMGDAKVSAATQDSIRIVNSIPEIFPDNTDRNRTSPFAFTGNEQSEHLFKTLPTVSKQTILLTLDLNKIRRLLGETDLYDFYVIKNESQEKAVLERGDISDIKF